MTSLGDGVGVLSKSPRDWVLGIDPGLSGAVAVVDGDKNLIAVFDMPVVVTKTKRKLDVFKLALQIETYADRIALTLIEDVGPMSGKEGVVGMFNFGLVTGMCHGICASLMLPIHLVKPAVWKTALGLGRDKNESRFLAQRQFPEMKAHFERKKDDGRAEAALLALFARRLL